MFKSLPILCPSSVSLCFVKVTTGAEGHTFLKLDAGMTDVLRPSLYGAQHPLVVVKVFGPLAP